MRLVDGDPETAWNSSTGDLVAWIEIRLPADAAVTAIALTAGFTRRTDRADLFTGNHRVRRVRVTRDGQELVEHALDTSSRELQRIPVSGPGGIYRVEVVAVTPGTNRRWREVCISELQVLGRAPAMTPGERFPRLALRRLLDPRPAPGSVEAAALRRLARDAILSIERTWAPFEREQRGPASTSTGRPSAEQVPLAEYRRTRRAVLHRIADLVDLADPVRADRLRAAAARQGEWDRRPWTGAMHEADLDTITAACEAVLARLGQDDVACQWARTHAGLRLERVGWALENRNDYWEMTQGYAEEGDLGPADHRASEQVCAWEPFQTITASWPRESLRIARQLGSLTLPDDVGAQAERSALDAQLGALQSRCR